MSPPVERLSGWHAEPEELVAYRARQLGEEEIERLRDHLALCPECTELLLDLASFEEVEPRLGVTLMTPDREMVESYAALMAVVEPGAGGGEAEERPDAAFARPRPALETVYRPLPWMRTILPWTVAASMAIMSGVLWLQRTHNPKVFSFSASRDVRSASQKNSGLILTFRESEFDQRRFPEYRVAIRAKGGPIRDVSSGFTFDGSVLQIGILPKAYPPGTYDAVLIGVDGDQKADLVTKEFTIR